MPAKARHWRDRIFGNPTAPKADVAPPASLKSCGGIKKANNQWATLWETETKAGRTDLNSVRAVVKNTTITVIVNGQTVKSVRALFPSGDLKFGFIAEYNKTSATPVSFPVHSYKVTAVVKSPAAVMKPV